MSLPFKRVLREAQSPAKLSSSPVLGEHTCLTSGARCPGTGEMRQAWMVPHLLSPPRAVVVGRRERLGKEGCWGAGWTLKAGSRCERLQDSGAGRRREDHVHCGPKELVPATGQDGRGEGRRLGCRGPVCSHHGGRVKGGISTNSRF